MRTIRTVRPAELARLAAIERAAGDQFRRIGMDAVADDDPFSEDELEGYRRDGRAWVAVDSLDRPVGYALAELLDDNAHLEQVSVHPSKQGEGIGRALVEQVAAWARRHRRPAMTLTTFADVPWNAPYYRRLGFRVLADAEIGPGLRAKRAAEAAHGLDAWPRVCMRREL